MAFFIVSDNYDDGQEVAQCESRQELIKELVRRVRLGDTLARVEFIIEGEEIAIPEDEVAAESQRQHDFRKERRHE